MKCGDQISELSMLDKCIWAHHNVFNIIFDGSLSVFLFQCKNWLLKFAAKNVHYNRQVFTLTSIIWRVHIHRHFDYDGISKCLLLRWKISMLKCSLSSIEPTEKGLPSKHIIRTKTPWLNSDSLRRMDAKTYSPGHLYIQSLSKLPLMHTVPTEHISGSFP